MQNLDTELVSDKKKEEFEYGLSDEIKSQLLQYLEDEKDEQGEKLRKLFFTLHPADQADFATGISYELRERLISIIADKIDPQFLTHLEGDIRNEVIEFLGVRASARALDKLEVDDAVHVISDLKDDGISEILNYVSEDKRTDIQEALSYPDSSVGRIMHQNFVAVKQDWNVAKATKYLQEKTDLPDDFHYIVVVDDNSAPIAEVMVSKIITSKKDTPIISIMSNPEDLKRISVQTDQEDAARLFSKYALSYAPVVDEKNILVGIIYASDVIDILDEEAEEDILLLGGVNDSNLHSSAFLTVRSRIPWLFTSLITTSIAVIIIAIFSGEIQKIVALAVLMPIVASLAGNAGTQALTVLIRSIATNEIDNIGTIKILFKELFVGSLNGIFLAVIASLICFFWQHNLKLSLILGASIFLTIVAAGFCGAVIPLLLNKMKFDPAISSGVFLIAVTDTSSFLIFLGLASLFMS